MRVGIYQVYWGQVGGGQRYIGVVAQLLAREHQVEIVHHCVDFDRSAVEEAMGLDLSRVTFRYVPPIERPSWSTRNPLSRLRRERELGAEISRPYDLFIDSSDIPPLFCHARRGVLLIHFPLLSFAEFHGHATDGWERRPSLARWTSRWFHRWEWRQRLSGYQLCVVNSAFTQRWLKRLWGRDAEIVNPPMRGGFEPRPKEPLILSIGAFRSGHHKKHGVTIDVFKGLCDRGLTGWRYLPGWRLRDDSGRSGLPRVAPGASRRLSHRAPCGREWGRPEITPGASAPFCGTAWDTASTRSESRG